MDDEHDNSNYLSQQLEDYELQKTIKKLRAIQGDWDKDYLPEDSGMTKDDKKDDKKEEEEE